MGNHRKHIVWPNLYSNPNYTLCPNNTIDTWPHLLSTCSNPQIKGLRIARHNKATPLITIIAGVREAIHEQPIKELEKIKYPKLKLKHL